MNTIFFNGLLNIKKSITDKIVTVMNDFKGD